jgi:hypothetical protein
MNNGFKQNELAENEIEDILEEMKIANFNGIYSRDEITEDDMKKGFYIINLDDRDGIGTHWVAFYFNPPLISIYFDSFGFVPAIEIEQLIKPYIYNKKTIQDLNSSSCGYFCIAFIKFLSDNKRKDIYKTFEAFINIFDNVNTKKNEDLLFELLALTSNPV